MATNTKVEIPVEVGKEQRFHPCGNARDLQLYLEGKLGVACSSAVLMANIERILENWNNHIFDASVDEVLNNPQRFGGWSYQMAYFPESGREVVKVTGRNEERVKFNLAYKILKRKASYGAGFERRDNPDGSVTMSAIPIILDVPM